MRNMMIVGITAFFFSATVVQAETSLVGLSCYQVSGNKCMITFNSLTFDDADSYCVRIGVGKYGGNPKVLAQVNKDGVPAVTISNSNIGGGIPVACGKLGEGLKPTMGASYFLSAKGYDVVENDRGGVTAYINCPAK